MDLKREKTDLPSNRRESRESAAPWLGWVLGPAAWALQHAGGYAMIPSLCETGQTWPYHALIGACIALCGIGATTAGFARRSAKNGRSPQSSDRLRFMSFGGYLLSAGSLAAILVSYFGAVWIGLCTGQG